MRHGYELRLPSGGARAVSPVPPLARDHSPAAGDRSSPHQARSAHHPRRSSHGRHAVAARSVSSRVSTSRHDATEQAIADEVPSAPAPIADPAPLGLAAFALTTFLLSAANANWMGAATGDSWLGYALAYGGSVQ